MENEETHQPTKTRLSAYLPFRLDEGLCNVRVNDKIIQLKIEHPEHPFFNPDGLLSDDVGRLWSVNEGHSRVDLVALYSSIAASEIPIITLDRTLVTA